MVDSGWNPAYGPPGAYSDSSRGGLLLGPAAGLVAALVGGLLWAVTVEVTGYQIGFAAIGVGLLVGQTMALTAGAGRRLPLVAAGLALVGCALGDLFVDAHEVAKLIGMGTPAMVRYLVTHPDLLVSVVKAGFSPLSIVFWALAASAGYRLAARGRAPQSTTVRPMARAVAGPDFNSPPPVQAAPVVVARHPSDFFNRPSEPRHTPQARQAALADQGLLQSLPPSRPTAALQTSRPARTI